MSKSKLSSVLVKWESEGGDLAGLIRNLGANPIRDRADAQAVCHALACPHVTQPDVRARTITPVLTLAALFQHIANEEAFVDLGHRGLPLLRTRAHEWLGQTKDRETDDLLFILKILAGYGRVEDLDLIVEAARLPLDPQSHLWPLIFEQMDDGHRAWRRLYDGLREPLPEGVLGVAYLDFASGHVSRAGLDDHPFASPAGVAKLHAWLSDPDEEHFSRAHSAAAALPFLPEASRKELLALADAHPDIMVRMEAAWARAKSGDERGRRQLQDWCRDAKVSRSAGEHLEELGHPDDIPAETREPDFQAAAEMCAWLTHPMEFARPPDRIELYDKRVLFWPPTNDRRPVWLFQYTYLPVKEGKEPETGIAMVGSVTFALFSEVTETMSPEDVYGIHCCWELKTNNDPRAPHESTAAAGRKILSQRNTGFE